MGDSPLFRVGDDVELWRMLLNFTALALAVTAFEAALHALERRLERYAKYHQMITKVYRELMILGLLGLGIKVLKEAGAVEETSPEMVAFVSADLTLFFLALALIGQAIAIFLQLRLKNKHLATLELLGSDELYAVAAAHERARRSQHALARLWSAGMYDDAVQTRLLRHLFLRAHALPELFPFAKYLRAAQDQQISHMIDMDASTWLLVFAVAWSMNASISAVRSSALFADSAVAATTTATATTASTVEDSHSAALLADAARHYALAAVFAAFAYTLLLLHIVAMLVLRRHVRALLRRADVASEAQTLARLQHVAVEEATSVASEATATAIARMEAVLEEQQVLQHERRRHRLAKHDAGFQLVASLCRALTRQWRQRAHNRREAQSNERDQEIESADSMHQATPAPAPASPSQTPPRPLHLRSAPDASTTAATLRLDGFSRKAWHVAVMLLLVLTGLFTAMFVQMVVSHVPSFVRALGFVPTLLLLPLPLALNWVVQPRLLRTFILLSSLAEIHVETLRAVVTGFVDAVERQNQFVATLLHCLATSHTSVDELARHFGESDPLATGWIDVETMRQLLARTIGLRLSFFQFNAVVRLLFQVRRLQVDYRKVVTLVRLASDGGHSSSSQDTSSSRSGHGQSTVSAQAIGHGDWRCTYDGSASAAASLDRVGTPFRDVSAVLRPSGLERPSKVTQQMLQLLDRRYAHLLPQTTTATAAVVTTHSSLQRHHHYQNNNNSSSNNYRLHATTPSLAPSATAPGTTSPLVVLSSWSVDSSVAILGASSSLGPSQLLGPHATAPASPLSTHPLEPPRRRPSPLPPPTPPQPTQPQSWHHHFHTSVLHAARSSVPSHVSATAIGARPRPKRSSEDNNNSGNGGSSSGFNGDASRDPSHQSAGTSSPGVFTSRRQQL